MINRMLLPELQSDLARSPAVALLGPRQAGKTTLALEIGQRLDATYLDLESEQDRAKLASPELYLGQRLDRLIILDEVHRVPGLFPVLRGLIDQGRRQGRRAGLYLLLGSASPELLKQASESLAGRIAYRELTPFTASEIPADGLGRLWLRGGFPDSYLAADEAVSLRWRQDFIRTYLEREAPLFGGRIGPEALRRLWGMLAHGQGGLLNSARLAASLGMDVRTVNRYVDLLVELFLVRRLQPWHANAGKRLTRSPKLYVRDSGILHALLAIRDEDTLLSHPVAGTSWEGFAIESLIAAGRDVQAHFYRTAAGAELDLVLVLPGGEVWAVEIKRSLSPKPGRGFHSARADVQPARSFIVYPGMERFPIDENLEAISLPALCALVAGASHNTAPSPLVGEGRGEG